MKEISQPEEIHLQIVEVMKRFPEGISRAQIKSELGHGGVPPEHLRHLARRIRELDKWFLIDKTTITDCAEQDRQVLSDQERSSGALRAEVLYGAHGRCQHCAKSIELDGIVLMVERREPEYYADVDCCEDWWAVCHDCSVGTKACVVSPMTAGARPIIERCGMSPSGILGRHRR